jgi:hypothetical protein
MQLVGVCLAIACASSWATARAEGQSVHRCIGAQGEIVFSGLPCGAAGATDAPASAPPDIERSMAAPVCPASTDALRTLIAQALARRDANAIAGVLRWDGVGGAEARRRLRELSELATRPLLGIDVDGGDEAAAGEPAASLPAALTVRTGSGDDGGTREHEFRISTSGGCYWLDW